MLYSQNEVLDYVREEDVKFIRLAFFDIFGKQKNVSLLPTELKRAFESGISFDASAIRGFGDESHSDLLLFPDPSTMQVLPWRSSNGRVIRMFCDIKRPDGSFFECDSRRVLKTAVNYAKDKGFFCNFGSEFEFYLFKTDENGEPTKEPYDKAGYMDIAPDDKGENVRREICLTLEEMGICPETSHHEEGPGQNEIDFKYSGALHAADDAATMKSVVKTVAAANGLYADFSPKPLLNEAGSGMHINISVKSEDGADKTESFVAGIMKHIKEITCILNPTKQSYQRLGRDKAPKFISWSDENRSQLIRIPAAEGEYKRIELRSPDAEANAYLAYALLIYSGLDGVLNCLCPPLKADINLFSAPEEITEKYELLPLSLAEAKSYAEKSEFLSEHLPNGILKAYLN